MSARRSRRSHAPVEPYRVEVELTGIHPSGEAAGVHENKLVYAAFGLPGERVELEVWEDRPDHLRGVVARILHPSPERVTPRCPYFGACGGCQWQHAPYAQQLSFKQQSVADLLARHGGFDDPPVLPTLPCPEPYGYRNHARFSVGRRHGEVGYTTHYHHRFMRIDECPIAHPRINAILSASQRRAQGHQLAVRVGTRTGELLVNPPQDADLPYESGQTALEEELLGRRYRVSAAAFFQVNTAQAERLIETVRAALELRPGDVLLDLYCGVGAFGLALAPLVRRVVGVEESAAALKDAAYNARDLDNVEFVAGRSEEVLAAMREAVDAVVVDPPRVGCRPGALEALLRLAPRTIAYVSCDPATLGRDLRVLVDGGYTLQSVQPVDMFPQTAHVEAVALLTSYSRARGLS